MLVRNLKEPYSTRFDKDFSLGKFYYKMEWIAREVQEEYGDQGSCVLGYEMYVQGMKLCNQPWQGSVTCQIFYERVADYLVSLGIKKSDMFVEYGRMD
jgi:hypothetical protein